MNGRSKSLHIFDCRSDLLADLGGRSQLRIPQPIMADHSVFIRIRNGALFQLGHCGEGFIDALGFLLKKIVGKINPA